MGLIELLLSVVVVVLAGVAWVVTQATDDGHVSEAWRHAHIRDRRDDR